MAELLHILQPLAHLSCLALCGENSWKPLILSLVLDCSSLSLHSQAECLTERERRELVRRRMALLFYLLRSPLYDRKSKVKSVFFINVGTRVGKINKRYFEIYSVQKFSLIRNISHIYTPCRP